MTKRKKNIKRIENKLILVIKQAGNENKKQDFFGTEKYALAKKKKIKEK